MAIESTIQELYSVEARKRAGIAGFNLETCIDEMEFKTIFKLIKNDTSIVNTIEIGCALGYSSIAILSGLVDRDRSMHTIIDPFQETQWKGVGRRRIERFGCAERTAFIYEKSEFALPRIVEKDQKYDFALIDGWHTFDHTMLDLFYVMKIIRVGGYIVVDDTSWPAVSKAVTYVASYPCIKKMTSINIDRFGSLIPRRADMIFEFVPTRFKDWLQTKLNGSMTILKKIDHDERNWDWYKRF